MTGAAGTGDIGLDAMLALLLAGVRPMVMLALLPPVAGVALPWVARLAVATALAVFGAFGPGAVQLAAEDLPGEVLAGLTGGLAVALAFAAASMAGEMAASIIGLGFASFATAAGNVSVIGQLNGLVMALAWLSTDGHLRLLEGMVAGSLAWPMGLADMGLADRGLGLVADYGRVMFEGALRMALPVVGLLLLGNLLVAMVVRAAPQLGALAIGPPLLLVILVWALPVLLDGLVARAVTTLEAGVYAAGGLAR
jgi:flagellar biosynthetic protein FliR